MKSDQAYIEMLLQDFKKRAADDLEFQGDVDEIMASINQIKLQIDRCARITHSILTFGRLETPKCKTSIWPNSFPKC
jgi:hypothetical protein